MSDPGEHLPGGSGGVWRIRDPEGRYRVHRPTGPWTPAVHELLAFLSERGLDGIPAVLGYDDAGREVLEYLPGEAVDPDGALVSDDVLVAAVRWLRRFHRAVSGFRPSHATWRNGQRTLANDEIICHNDPGVTNWVVDAGRFAGMIDWDRAGPGRPVDDLAFLCWSAIPLMRASAPEEVARRLVLVAEAYASDGVLQAIDLLDAVDARMALITERWQAGIAANDPGTIALRDAGIMAAHAARVEEYRGRRPAIRSALLVIS